MGKIIYVTINGKKVKYSSNDKGDRITLFKESKHVFKKWESFGINEDVLNHFISKGVKEIFIIWTRTDKSEELFKTKISDWATGKRTDYGDVQLHMTLATLREITNSFEKVVFIEDDKALNKYV